MNKVVNYLVVNVQIKDVTLVVYTPFILPSLHLLPFFAWQVKTTATLPYSQGGCLG